MITPVYTYNATIISVIDGDSLKLCIDLGFNVTIKLRCRLARINAAELSDPRPEIAEIAQRAKKRIVLELISDMCTIRSSKPYTGDKFGRWLVEIYAVGSERSVNQILLDQNLALQYPEKY